MPEAKTDAQKGGQKTVPAIPHHGKENEHSHRPSREVERGESVRGDSQRTPRTRGTYVKEPKNIQGKGLCFDTVNEEKSKRTYNDTESSTPKRLKSVDSQAPGKPKEDLRDYLQRKWQNAEVTSPVKPRTPFSVELDRFDTSKRFHMPRFQIYNCKSDMNFHVGLYLNSMALYTENESLLCKVFPSSFGEIASDWFHKLPKGTIKSWKGLAEMFVARFVTNKLQPLK
ncbi:hypothetical protein ACSBR2_020482 [Camellia fascicularis]